MMSRNLLAVAVVGLLLALFWQQTRRTPGITTMHKKRHQLNEMVQIYDNVLPWNVLQELEVECREWDNLDVVLEWPLPSFQNRSFTRLEQILASLVTELYGGHTKEEYYIEYWTRQQWYHTLPHADMDEGLRLHQEGQYGVDAAPPFAHPLYGHVLYLAVGSKVQGPTVVFADVSKGGDFSNNDKPKDMVVSPAVPNRLLRFQGHLLHAVPRPADIWLTRRQDPSSKTHTPQDAYGRSVLLFNLWPKSHLLWGRTVRNATREGQHSSDDGGQANAFSSWQSIPIEPSNDIENKDGDSLSWLTKAYWKSFLRQHKVLELPLLGDARRRGTDRPSVRLETLSDVATVREALTESTTPKHVLLRKKE